jgi:uncharacterized protein (TIGR02186 family)
MQIYLPIAGISLSFFLLLGLGGGVGLLSGLFGVGGGFLLTPLLIFVGVPPGVAVGSQACQLVASSVAGSLVHAEHRQLDYKLGLVMAVGSGFGALAGVALFRLLKQLGQVDLVISLSYVILLGGIGGLMLYESFRAVIRRRKGITRRGRPRRRTFLHGLPGKLRFPASRLYVSAFLPGGIGFVGGLLVSVLGIGGGFVLIPAMIYLLGMPALLVAGTSLFQIAITSAIAALLHASVNYSVDIVLALTLMVGGVLGSQVGSRLALRLRGDILRVMLALIVLAVCFRLAEALIATPSEAYKVEVTEATGREEPKASPLAGADGPLLISDVSPISIAIESGFTGADVVIFGMRQGEGEVAVTVFGPVAEAAVRPRHRFAGIWVDGARTYFYNVPSFYWWAASTSLSSLAPDAVLNERQIDQDHLFLRPEHLLPEAERIELRAAILRERAHEGLYPRPGQVFFTGDMFRANLHIPANVPTGVYTVDTYLIEDGKALRRDRAQIFVAKAGNSARIVDFANNRPILYAVFAIFAACTLGAMSGIVFRRL